MANVIIQDPRADSLPATKGYVGTVPPTSGSTADATKSNFALRSARPAQRFIATLTVAGGAAFDSGVLDASMLEGLTIRAVNGSAVTARTVTITFLEDGGQLAHTITRTLPVNATELYVIGAGRDAAGVVELVTIAAPIDTHVQMRVQVSAAGADAVTIAAWGH